MSREEQLAAKGQLLEDFSRLKQLVATLSAALERQAMLLRQTGEHISGVVDPPHSMSNPPDEPEWSEILSVGKIQSTLREFRSENKRLHQMRARLHNVGFPADSLP